MSEIHSQYSEVLPSESISQVESHNDYSEEEEDDDPVFDKLGEGMVA